VSPKASQPQETAPDLSPEKAYSVLSAQLEKLQILRGQDYRQAKAAEDEWYHLTEKLVMRSFGRASPNYRNFVNARSAGEHYMRTDFNFGGYAGIDHGLNQRNLLARLQGYEDALKSSLAELKIDLPDAEIDKIRTLLPAQGEIFVIDPYLSAEIFDVYAGSIPRSVTFRLLSNNLPSDVKALAQKYASGGNLQFRSSASVHDRGEAYLAAHLGSEAAVEFHKILDHRGIVANEPIGALAHLGLARAYAMQDDTAKARAAYQDFLTLWKDADADIPVLIAAKAEYAKLN
jgi:hypothetical protein